MTHIITTSPTTPTSEKLNALIQQIFANPIPTAESATSSHSIEYIDIDTAIDERIVSIHNQTFAENNKE